LRFDLQEPEATIAELSSRLQKAEAALQQSEHLVVAGRYAGAIMHEVNNPLEALTNLVYLTKHAPLETANVVANMEIAESQLLILGEITRKTLSFYNVRSEAKDFDLVNIMEAALTLHVLRTGRQRIEIRKQIQGPAVARVMAGEILQILSNLIRNSLDALSDQGGILSLRVKVCNGNVLITVADNGTGIEASIYERMFQPHRTTKSQGTGFGLWLSRNIVNHHHGTIICRSSRIAGRSGTTFRLSLPVSEILSGQITVGLAQV
jgi:signal transduction histidine kinase